MREYDIEVDVYDPWADPIEVKHEYNINTLITYPEGIDPLAQVCRWLKFST